MPTWLPRGKTTKRRRYCGDGRCHHTGHVHVCTRPWTCTCACTPVLARPTLLRRSNPLANKFSVMRLRYETSLQNAVGNDLWNSSENVEQASHGHSRASVLELVGAMPSLLEECVGRRVSNETKSDRDCNSWVTEGLSRRVTEGCRCAKFAVVCMHVWLSSYPCM